jgi:hypothetical protein
MESAVGLGKRTRAPQWERQWRQLSTTPFQATEPTQIPGLRNAAVIGHLLQIACQAPEFSIGLPQFANTRIPTMELK